ncbi:ATP phosphoribosyltransferase regulatory subunit [Agrococcus sp. SL85]|uniref:histidine--tRNA ligase n=1 Tax=Agrococcus sp. SL85 TaxID=2995141 RepID=UPI00226C7556|nr:ATP phosphoribosyltransferase regulatory subunit [Agrococcus sp. SL85]WAC65323.1 ATP phosphoribosyltransferase regulatory subunit [Agrococcus sp. SL85]
MATQVHPPRGMRDFLPVDKRRRERVLRVIREAYEHHGFEEIETPVVEDAARLHAGLGGDNEKLAFAIMRRGLTGDDLQAARSPLELADLGLRFDLTVPLARFLSTHRSSLPPVFRAIQIAPVWRAERPQRGRFRQFVQCDIDIAGEPGIAAELELLAATGDALERLGLTGTHIRINDRRVLLAALEHAGVPDAQREGALITVDKLDKVGREGVVAELAERGVDGAALLATLDAIGAGEAPEGFDAATLEPLRELMAAHVGVPLVLDPTLVRGMGYYTGAIFEVAHPDLPFSIGGGGRYDGMVGRFLGQEVPAVGISLGFERLVDLVELPEEDGREVVALLVDKQVPPVEALAIKRALIAQGRTVRMQRRPKNPQGLLDQLVAAGATHVAFVRPGDSAEDLEPKPIS